MNRDISYIITCVKCKFRDKYICYYCTVVRVGDYRTDLKFGLWVRENRSNHERRVCKRSRAFTNAAPPCRGTMTNSLELGRRNASGSERGSTADTEGMIQEGWRESQVELGTEPSASTHRKGCNGKQVSPNLGYEAKGRTDQEDMAP